MAAFFLAFEGIEGSGKSTQLQRLAALLRDRGAECVITKEPGGTAIGDRVRAILLDPESREMAPLTELLLYAASRRQNVVENIEPALAREAVVLCDRFTDSTLAYQGYGRRLPLGQLRTLNDLATGGRYPDLVLIYDLPELTGLARARQRNVADALEHEGRFEAEDLRFHRMVREGYRALAASDPARYVLIDGDGSIDEVFARTCRVLEERAPSLGLERNR